MPSLNNTIQFIAAGLARVDIHRIDSSGLPAGLTGTVTPGATGVPAVRLTAAKTFPVGTPDSQKTPVTGDNVLQGTFQWPSTEPRAFEMTVSEDHFPDREAMQGIKYRNIGNFSFAGRDIQPFVLNTCMFIGVSNAKSQSSGLKGLGMYSGVIANRAEMLFRGRQTMVERDAMEIAISVTANAFDAYPWGETFQTAVEGYTSLFIDDWTLPFPVTVHRWTQGSGGGAVAKFYLGEKPASTSLDDVLVYVIDTTGNFTRKTSGVTISDTDNSLTFSPQPTDDFDIVSMYGYVPS